MVPMPKILTRAPSGKLTSCDLRTGLDTKTLNCDRVWIFMSHSTAAASCIGEGCKGRDESYQNLRFIRSKFETEFLVRTQLHLNAIFKHISPKIIKSASHLLDTNGAKPWVHLAVVDVLFERPSLFGDRPFILGKL